MRVGAGIFGATSDMAHPHGYAFFMSLALSVFVGFIFYMLAGNQSAERNTAVLTVGFLIGGFVFSWLYGGFDGEYGLAAAAGFAVGLLGTSFVLLRREADHD